MQALSTVVREHRHGRLREVMRAHRLDALLFTGADFFSFASNHDMTDLAWERPFLLILPASGSSVAVLAEQVDLVPGAREGLRERGVVDVGAGPAEQVAVEDEDAHEPVQGTRRGPCYGSPR